MAEPRYLVRRISNTATHRIHSIQCLNNSGVAIALASTNDGRDYGLAVCARDAATGEWRATDACKVADPVIRNIDEPGQFVGWSTHAGRERALAGHVEPALEIDVERKPFDFSTIEGEERNKANEAGLGQFVGRTRDGLIICAYGVIAGEGHEWFANARGCTDSIAAATNASGETVGFGRALEREFGAHACLWRAGESVNLNDLVDELNVHLREATAINDDGWIACTGGEGEPVILEPIRS